MNRAFIRLLAFAGFLAVAFASSAAEMYYNPLAGDVTIPSGTYGEIVLSDAIPATQLGTTIAEITTTAGTVRGGYGRVIRKLSANTDTCSHTVAGWFKLTKKTSADTVLWAVLSKTASNASAGYKVAVTQDGYLKVGKSKYPLADNGVVTSTATVPDGQWFYLAVAIEKSETERTATVKAFVNGTPLAMGDGTFPTNLNGDSPYYDCKSLRVGDGVAVAGLRIDDAVVTDPVKICNWAVDTVYTTATWTGAVSADPTDGENWSTGVVPDANTVVVLESPLKALDAHAPLACRGLSALGDMTLDGDCDLTGFSVELPICNRTIDVKGHVLKLKQLVGTKINDSTTDAAHPGELHFQAEPGETEIHGVLMSGNLIFVKEGEGTIMCTSSSQTYTGGTVVNAGVIKAYANETGYYYGADGTPLTINAGGALDINAKWSWYKHPIYLNGGSIRNDGSSLTTTGSNGFGDITLLDDSSIDAKYHMVFNNSTTGIVDLDGHTLQVNYVENSDPKAILYFNNSIITNGTVELSPHTVIYPMKATTFAAETSLILNGDMRFGSYDATVLDFTDNSLGSYETLNTHRVLVTGRYTPKSDHLVNVTLKDGATLDLNGQEDVWTFTNVKKAQTIVYEGTVTVDVSGRELDSGTKLVAWTAKPTGVTFQWDATTAAKGVELVLTDAGLYYGEEIVSATWLGGKDDDVTDAANWACTNAAGTEVSGAFPGKTTIITMTTATMPSKGPVDKTLVFGYVRISGALDRDIDWSGYRDVKFDADSALDLKGHTFTVGSLGVFSGAMAFTDSAATKGRIALASGTSKLCATLSIAEGLTLYVGGGATLDCNGAQAETKFALRFGDGATLVNSGADVGDTTIQFAGGVTLDENATATFDLANAVNLVAPDYGKYPIALNGGTLVIDNKNDNFSIANGNVTGPGTIEAKGAKQFNVGYKGLTLADDVVLKVTKPGWLWAAGAATIPAIAGDGEVNAYSYSYTVTRRFAGSLNIGNVKAGLTLANGAALDLSMLSEPYSEAQFDKLSLTPGSTITVDLDGRDLAEGTKVISWSTIPTGITFAWDDATAAKAPEVKPIAGPEGLLYGADPAAKEIDVAHWTGQAGFNRPTDPINWACTNFLGEAVVGGVPNARARIVIHEKLTEDTDWTALGPITFSSDSRLDLNAYNFTLAGFSNYAADAVITNAHEDSLFTSDLIVNVGEGQTTTNDSVRIGGNIRLVKRGAGVFEGALAQQLYTGGTLVAEGSITSHESESTLHWGAKDTTVTVDPDGILDIGNTLSWCFHKIVLAGGAIRNVAGHETPTSQQGLGNVTLTADSRMLLSYHTVFYYFNTSTEVDLGGHTLSVEYVDRGPTDDPKAIVYINRSTWKNGTAVFGTNTVFRPQSNARFDTASIVINGDMQPQINVTVRDLTDNSMGQFETYGDYTVTVTGVYTPLSSYLHNTHLANGATLALPVDREEAWTFTCKSGKNQTLTFDENATIKVDLSGRTDLTLGKQIVAWTEETPPPESVQFEVSGAPYSLDRRSDGLYLDAAEGLVIGVR